MIIEYSNTIMNLDKLIYGLVQKYQTTDYYTRWRFVLHFEHGKELKWGNFKTEEEARDKQADFMSTVQKLGYVIPEMSP